MKAKHFYILHITVM